VVPNTARTALLVNGRPLPWDEWAERFRENLPPEILALMEEVADGRSARDRTEAFKQRMKGLANLLFIGGNSAENLRRLFALEADPRSRNGKQDGDDVPATARERNAATTRSSAPGSGAEPDEARATPPREGPKRDDSDRDTPLPELDLDRLLELEAAPPAGRTSTSARCCRMRR